MGSSEYMREWRKTEAGKAAMRKARERATLREKALRLLGQRHPEELAQIIEQFERLEELAQRYEDLLEAEKTGDLTD